MHGTELGAQRKKMCDNNPHQGMYNRKIMRGNENETIFGKEVESNGWDF